MSETKKIGFIGCGNMANAIIQGLINHNYEPNQIIASNRSTKKLEHLELCTKINTTNDNIEVAKMADTIILSVKPQILPQVCEQLAKVDLSNKLIISIAVGISTAQIIKIIGQNIALIRAMPNTPATISEGATGLFANTQTTQAQKEVAESIFSATGKIEWVHREPLIDVVAAIAGSAPAYIFLFLESMIEQAVKEGLPPNTARNLATQAVLGASKLAQANEEVSLQNLRHAVTSPGGTTAAALNSFKDNDFSNTIKQAIAAAIARAKELGEY